MVAHYTPGKRWDSFCTHGTPASSAWARHTGGRRAGPPRAGAVSSGPENSDFAFVHHGSLVPVQFTCTRTPLARAQDKAGLLRLLSGDAAVLRILAGTGEGSTTARFVRAPADELRLFLQRQRNGRLCGTGAGCMRRALSGQRQHLILFTAHVIRAAKILSQSARRLGLVQDEERCGRDIERLSAALQCA